MLEEDFSAFVIANAGVVAVMGSRFYPLYLPQSPSYPAATYQRISAPRDYTSDGADGHVPVRMQIDVYGERYADARAGADALRLALSGYRGAMGSSTIRGIFLDTDRDLTEAGLDQAGPRLYRASLDFIIHHKEV